MGWTWKVDAMLLTRLVFTNYGPFAVETELQLEPDLTVLTGANDSGKSSLLNLVRRTCGVRSQEQSIQQHEVNLDRIGEADCKWEQDPQIACEAYFQGTKFSEPHVGDWGEGDEIQLSLKLAPQIRTCELNRWKRKGGEWSIGGSVVLRSLPAVIHLPLAHAIRPVIELDKPNPVENLFLKAVFGPRFSFDKYSSISDSSFHGFVSIARGDANQKLRGFLPQGVSMEIHFESVKGERRLLSVHLRDTHSGHTPLEFRGSGIRRMIVLMSSLLSNPLESGHHIILLDEPETSLHADAQHTLRRMLEDIAERDNIQVVYATHSPSMINAMRPHSLRVVCRAQTNHRATSQIIQKPFADNFFAVRSSLGITPADSLLFAPVTLIVEGSTEVLGIPLILTRLQQAEIEGFEDASLVLSQSHVVDGCGDSFEYLCRLAKSQGTKPVIFLDGDKAARAKKVNREHEDVPLIFLDDGLEFEQIMPKDIYFQAMREVLREFAEIEVDKMTVEAFEEWTTTAGLPSKMAFTKKIDRWLEDKWGGLPLNKPATMKRAIQRVEATEIRVGELRKLLSAMTRLLD